jgi:hypothetical protein
MPGEGQTFTTNETALLILPAGLSLLQSTCWWYAEGRSVVSSSTWLPHLKKKKERKERGEIAE